MCTVYVNGIKIDLGLDDLQWLIYHKTKSDQLWVNSRTDWVLQPW